MSDKKNLLLSIEDLKVQFHVRGRLLTAIRGISLDIYENECIAIVGESGSGKSVFTKTFAGMLDSNGFVSNGSIIFHDESLTDIRIANDANAKSAIENLKNQLDAAAPLSFGAQTWKQILELESELRKKGEVGGEESEKLEEELDGLITLRVNLFNAKQTLDPVREKEELKKCRQELKEVEKQIKDLAKQQKAAAKAAKAALKSDTQYQQSYQTRMSELKAKHAQDISREITPALKAQNEVLAKEIVLSVSRYGSNKKKLTEAVVKALTESYRLGVDLANEQERNKIFDEVLFRVAYCGEDEKELWGRCVLNLAKVRDVSDWLKIRGSKIATVFQDPMTSLNPIITIGKQISSIIMKHQGCSESEARMRALEMMAKVGIPHPENRYDDYPFQYSGGMRQRIVIAIALSCQPKILICDEPTTALDVTIQAQILQLIKDLQKEFHYTTVFITHDLGVVANVADRVAVLYAGQIVELGTVEEVFYDPQHPYTWALLSSLPSLAERNTKLYSITGTPPSLYNDITGDAFAPRNPYCLKIDTLAEPPMFRVSEDSETHYAKTWLLHPDAPKVEKPEQIQDIHGKLMKAFHI